MRSGDEIAITLEEHRAIMATRQRPLTDSPISNRKATVWRSEQATIASSPVDPIIDVVEGMTAARRSRAQRESAVEAAIPPVLILPADRRRLGEPAECGTQNGYQAHRARGGYACAACKAAHSAYVTERTRASKQRRKAS